MCTADASHYLSLRRTNKQTVLLITKEHFITGFLLYIVNFLYGKESPLSVFWLRNTTGLLYYEREKVE